MTGVNYCRSLFSILVKKQCIFAKKWSSCCYCVWYWVIQGWAVCCSLEAPYDLIFVLKLLLLYAWLISLKPRQMFSHRIKIHLNRLSLYKSGPGLIIYYNTFTSKCLCINIIVNKIVLLFIKTLINYNCLK